MTKTKRTSETIETFYEKSFFSKEEWSEWYENLVGDYKDKDGVELVLSANGIYDEPPEVIVDIFYNEPMTASELKRIERTARVEKFAEEKGISPYEAGIVLSLQERGKL